MSIREQSALIAMWSPMNGDPVVRPQVVWQKSSVKKLGSKQFRWNLIVEDGNHRYNARGEGTTAKEALLAAFEDAEATHQAYQARLEV